VKILHVLATPDGAWRVEIVQRGARVTYRLVHGKDEIGPLTIGTLEMVLQDAGIDMADMAEVPDHAPTARQAVRRAR
jgi:hypothetical protein